MSRKDYIKIGRIIKDNSNVINKPYKSTINRDSLIIDLCIMFNRDNSLFDSNRFREACEQVVNKYIMIE